MKQYPLKVLTRLFSSHLHLHSDKLILKYFEQNPKSLVLKKQQHPFKFHFRWSLRASGSSLYKSITFYCGKLPTASACNVCWSSFQQSVFPETLVLFLHAFDTICWEEFTGLHSSAPAVERSVVLGACRLCVVHCQCLLVLRPCEEPCWPLAARLPGWENTVRCGQGTAHRGVGRLGSCVEQPTNYKYTVAGCTTVYESCFNNIPLVNIP